MVWFTPSPEKIADGSNGDVAVDSYHRYKEDVKILKDMGMDSYRFSISWSRVLPNGTLKGGINEDGIKYYNDLIQELLHNGINSSITLFHWDLPQALEDEYGGFLSPNIVNDFRDYAELCFQRFGDRVKSWITLNEPWSYSSGGYDSGLYAPGRCSSWKGNCTNGDSGTEPYLVSHHQLLAHAAAVKMYKEKYQASQKGNISIVLVSTWMKPFNDTSDDLWASHRALDFMLGWFIHPIIFGDYPKSMRLLVKDRLPKFKKEESKMLKGSFDYIGLNYYTTFYAKSVPVNTTHPSYSTDSGAFLTSFDKFGNPIGEQAGSDWLHIYPVGIWHLLNYIKRKYENPLLHITENGVDEINNSTLPVEEALKDNFRIKYYHRHLAYVHKAIENGANVGGYFGWSILDNFEWVGGYTVRFGITYVDFKEGLKRYPKLSAKWFKLFLQK